MPSRLPARLLVLLLGLSACKGKDADTGTGDTDNPDDLPGSLTMNCDGGAFGDVPSGSSASVTMEAKNAGGGSLTLDGITIGAPFTALATTPIEVATTYKFTVRFEAEDFGEFTDTLTVAWSTGGEAQTPVTCAFSAFVTADGDGDGYDAVSAGGDDCDDEDPEVNPGEPENWYDGIDANCDGASDFDQDGDGYQSSVFNEDPPLGGDCQDVDPLINPGADEIIYDGVDQDCDGGNDFDQDGDGFTAKTYGGDDCDDFEPLVMPDAIEAFDGIDNDCDGVVDDGATADESSVLLVGDAATDGAGRTLSVGDFDGNGAMDLVIGVWYYKYTGTATGTAGLSQGAVSVFMDESWTDGDAMSDGNNFIVGANSKDELGFAVADIGDFDTDGVRDVAMSAPAYSSKAGRVYLLSGTDLEGGTIASAYSTYTGEDDFGLGAGITTETDMDGDGTPDLFLYGIDQWNVYNYLALDYGGGGTGNSTWDDIDSTWTLQCGTVGSALQPYCGPTTVGAQGGTETWANGAGVGGDINGDGYDDALLGDQYNDDTAKNSGKVWILWGRSSRYASSSGSLGGVATTVAEGAKISATVGKNVAIVPDADGDGDDEIFIEDGANELLYFFQGGADLSAGVLDLAADSDAAFTMTGDVITSTANIGDWSGDGTDDFAFAFGDEGEVWFFESQIWSGSVTPGTAIMSSLVNGVDNKYLGWGIAPRAADLNDDGSDDLAIGDYQHGSGAGAVHLFYQP